MKCLALNLLFIICFGVMSCSNQRGDIPAKTSPSLTEKNVSEWKLLLFPEGRFTILTPETLVEDKVLFNSGDAQIEMHAFRLTTFAAFSVIYYDVPPSLQSSVEEILSNLISGGIEQVNGRKSEEKQIALNNFPGRYLTIEAGDGTIVKVKLYVVNQRVYQIMIQLPNSRSLSENEKKSHELIADQFLESFKLIPETNVEKTEDNSVK